jgi:hypothetical protein
VTLVTGDSPWDFTLFLALRRWGTDAYWLPPELVGDEIFMHGFMGALRTSIRRVSDPQIQTVTTSDEAFRDAAVAQLSTAQPWGLATARPSALRASSVSWRDVLPDRPHRLLERDAPGRPEPVSMVGGSTVQLPTPIPGNAQPIGAGELSWVTDARVQGWAPVRHGALATDVISAPWFDSEHARTSRNGVSYTSAAGITFSGTSLQMSTPRPVLHPRELIAQLDSILTSEGWSCQASDKGAYSAESALLFGGFRPLAQALLAGNVRAVLDAFRDPTAPGKKAADRRYLTLGDMATLLRDEDAAEAVCDDLSSRGVLTLGLFLKCATCRRASWYELAAVTTTFTCRRCRRAQPLRRPNWLGTVEPLWYYELAEVVHALLEHNGELPLLTVHRLFPPPSGADDEVEVAFELEVFSPDGRKSEVDIAVRERSKLWLGEATTKNHFERQGPAEQERLQRLSDTADVLAAQGIVLASSQSFRAATRARAIAAFPDQWPGLLIEERVPTGPPEPVVPQLTLF